MAVAACLALLCFADLFVRPCSLAFLLSLSLEHSSQLARIDNLRGAILTGCDLKGCELGGVDMRGADITGCKFDGATVAKPANVSGVSGLETFEVGTMDGVKEGSLVCIKGFLITVTGTHPTNPLYAYHEDHTTDWAHVGTYDGSRSLWGDSGCMAGCFEKGQCYVLA